MIKLKENVKLSKVDAYWLKIKIWAAAGSSFRNNLNN
jgi:hypothetical protein